MQARSFLCCAWISSLSVQSLADLVSHFPTWCHGTDEPKELLLDAYPSSVPSRLVPGTTHIRLLSMIQQPRTQAYRGTRTPSGGRAHCCLIRAFRLSQRREANTIDLRTCSQTHGPWGSCPILAFMASDHQLPP